MAAVPKLRQTVNEILDKLPRDATIEDLQYHLYLKQKIERGLRDVAEGRVFSHEEVGRRIDQWAAGLNGRKKRENDLISIGDFIARDSIEYATSFVRSLHDAAEGLVDFPFRGPRVRDLDATALRQLSHRGYRIIYHVTEDAIYIIGIVHGARDLPALWKREARPKPKDGPRGS